MSASGNGGKTAEELLAALLTDTEHIAILKYANQHDLTSDDVVYFMVALLKVFAFVHDRILKAIDAAQDGRAALEAAVILAEQNLTDSVEQQVTSLRCALIEINNTIGIHAGQFSFAAGEIKGLKEEMDRTLKEARGTYHAFKRLSDDGTGTTLSQLFQKKAHEVIERRLASFDVTVRELIRKTISHEARKLMIFSGIQFVVIVILLIALRT